MKILMIGVKKMDSGGIESYLMNLFRNLPSSMHIDFVVHSNEKGYFDEEIRKKNCCVYTLPRFGRKPLKYIKELFLLLKKNDYDIVHRHATASIMWIDLFIAKLAGVKIRISHSHSSSWEHKIIHKLCIPMLNYISTDKFACSNAAGKWMYGNKKYIVMKNGIDINKFAYDSTIRKNYRYKYNLNDKKVVLMVARMVPVKNHLWFLDVVKETLLIDKNIIFVFAGDGVLFEQFKQKVADSNLDKNVLILGDRKDIPILLSIADLFVLPSLFEGLPITVIEAQCSGLECVVSNRISSEVNLGKVSILELDSLKWALKISSTLSKDNANREFGTSLIYENKYSMSQTVKTMENYYINKMKKKYIQN